MRYGAASILCLRISAAMAAWSDVFDVVAPDLAAQASRNRGQNLVTCLVAQLIIDQLEVVEVDHQHGLQVSRLSLAL